MEISCLFVIHICVCVSENFCHLFVDSDKVLSEEKKIIYFFQEKKTDYFNVYVLFKYYYYSIFFVWFFSVLKWFTYVIAILFISWVFLTVSVFVFFVSKEQKNIWNEEYNDHKYKSIKLQISFLSIYMVCSCWYFFHLLQRNIYTFFSFI